MTVGSLVARFRPVAKNAVVTNGIIRCVHAAHKLVVARIFGTPDAVIAVRRRARLAVSGCIAGFRPIAKHAVIARSVIGRARTIAAANVARVHGAFDTVAAFGVRGTRFGG